VAPISILETPSAPSRAPSERRTQWVGLDRHGRFGPMYGTSRIACGNQARPTFIEYRHRLLSFAWPVFLSWAGSGQRATTTQG
jgi:hypothetical protein